MNQHEVVKGYVFLNEKCVWCTAGHFVGIKTGSIYAGAEYRALVQYEAVIRRVDLRNETGMLHLNHSTMDYREPENRRPWKLQFVGCRVTVVEAHQNGETKVYRCLELSEYFSEHELELLSPISAISQ